MLLNCNNFVIIFRPASMLKEPFDNQQGVVFKEVVHDPNFCYRILRDNGNPPLHVDPIYRIMYPGAVVTCNSNVR